MSRKYRFGDQDHLHFVTFTTINWIDVFIREQYRQVLIDSVKYCQNNKGLEVYGYCLMTSHFHMIMGRNSFNTQEGIVRDLKSHTSGCMHDILERTDIVHESRREWLLWMMKRAGTINTNNNGFQFWQQHNNPIEIWTPAVFDQKLDYIHLNPVESGFVSQPEDWRYSSAVNYSGRKGVIDILYP
jgi:putative transposase